MTFLFNAEHPRGKSFPASQVKEMIERGWKDSPAGLESAETETETVSVSAINDPDLEAVAKSLDEQKKLLAAKEKEIDAREKAVAKAEANLAEQVKAFNEQVEAFNDNPDKAENPDAGDEGSGDKGDSDKTSAADDLTKLKGIGDTKAQKLAEAGVTTFKQIAELDIDLMEELNINDDQQDQAEELAAG